MNYLMFQQSGEGPKVPAGLKELMSDISREVLREQPENIYEFIAEYLEEMEIAREHKGIAENVLSMVIDESITVYEMFKESGISLEHAERSAKIIENSFNEYARKKKAKSSDEQSSSKAMEKLLERDVCQKIMQSCDLTREQDQKLRKIVQMCFKSFYFREKSYKLKLTRLPDSHWANRAEKTLDIYRQTAPDKSKLDRAAIVMQSAYRSYFVRKMPKEIQRFHECATKIQTRFRGHMAQKKLQQAISAAIKIQAMYKGYSTRKFLQNQREMEKMKNQPFLLVSELVDEIVTSFRDRKVKNDIPTGDATLKVTFDCSMKEQMAATTIQKIYRGFRARKKVKSSDRALLVVIENENAKYDDTAIQEQHVVIDSMQNCFIKINYVVVILRSSIVMVNNKMYQLSKPLF